jgi:hypothetical protein
MNRRVIAVWIFAVAHSIENALPGGGIYAKQDS